jgi:polyisoprenyl-teichoic acid--peptidoglycan teichoic acid transferase
MATTAPPGRTSAAPRPPSARTQQAEATRFRRALVLLAGTVVLPGIAQFLAGNRALGRAVMQAWAVIVGAVIVVAWLVPLDTLAGLAVRPWLLTTFTVVAFAMALGWIALVVDAWRLGDPPRLLQRHRLILLGTSLALVGLIATPFWIATRYANAAHDAVVAMFPSGQVAAASDSRLNILLIGSDAGMGRTGARPDSLNVVSVDVRTGATTMIGIPRNLERARFPSGTPAAAEFPRGFSGDGDREQWMINATWTFGEENATLFPDTDEPGPEAVRQAVEGTLGLPVHYYVIVNMEGFRDLVDALGGITVRVDDDIPVGSSGHVLEAGLHTLDGGEALWYARSRTGTSDYDRMSRQRCVLGAMANELDPGTVLQKFTDLAAASSGAASTSIPQQQLPQLVDMAWKARDVPITSLQLVPPLIVPADPDLDVIADELAEALDKARKAGQAAQAEAAADETGESSAAVPSDSAVDESTDSDAGSGDDEASSDDAEAAEGTTTVGLQDVCSYE